MKKIIFTLLLGFTFIGFSQNTAISDHNFELALIELGIDTNPTPDGQVPTANIIGETVLNVSNKNIADLTGIEGFIALTDLRCFNNELTSLNLSQNTALTYLDCDSNKLTSLDVSANSALETLICFVNELTSLEVTNNPALTTLLCNSNQLISLDLSQNAVLTDLRCPQNQLTSLDVSANPALTELNCSANQLTSLDVRNLNNTAITSFNAKTNPDLNCIFVDNVIYSDAEWTDIDPASNFVEDEADCPYTVIPDQNFEQALIDLGIDTNPTPDGQVLTADIEGVTNLVVNNENISNLTGIKGFTALTYLDCSVNQLTGLDVSLNTELIELVCYYNLLTSLNLGQNTALTYFDCSENLLTVLDVSANTALTQLYCWANKLTGLDVSQNTALTDLACDYNELTSLNVRENTELIELECDDNLLTGLDVSQNTALTRLYCSGNLLTGLDIRENTQLIELNCGANLLTGLDVRENTQLDLLNCYDNKLTDLDVSLNTALGRLYCDGNLLTSLDVRENIALRRLNCEANQLIGSLDLSKNSLLTELQCQSNKIERLNIKNGNNTNHFGVFFNASNNPVLYCIVVDDKDYSNAEWLNIDDVSTFVNNETDCETLSIVDNDFELDVTIYPNPTDNYLFIEGNVNPVSITIYNLLGAEVIAKSNTDKIDVSELSIGVYIINISDGVSQTNRKFIKN